MSHEELISNPAKYFENPEKILYADQLSKEQKKIALENWKQQYTHIQNSTSEGMEKAHSTQSSQLSLKDLNFAIEKLEALSILVFIGLNSL